MGELLIDFVSVAAGVSIKDSPGFTKAPGGAPANVAVGVRRLGRTSGFIGKVGSDDFGRFLGETLAREGVDTRGVRYEDRVRTMLAFVSLGPDGEREFMFYRHPSADMLLEPSEIDTDLIAGTRVFHHGSISLITEPSRSATLAAVEAARAAGALVSYDPNLRLPLWPTPDEARSTILAAAPSADIIKVSEEELAFLTGVTGVCEGVRRLRDIVPGDCAIVVTCGRRGCALALGGSGRLWLEVPGFNVRAVDTTGAGDAFVAGLLVGLIEATGAVGAAATTRTALRVLGEEEWRGALTLANAVGALCTTELGAIPALPTAAEVRAFLSARGFPSPGTSEDERPQGAL
ncbi:MAG: PfkB family carbohydrate kinase [Bacillota bacterium]|nr:PfkB family carbohydrate kinase [Bacillota bacterium]